MFLPSVEQERLVLSERTNVEWRTATQGDISSLTGLRGLAAIHILMFHLYAYFDRSVPTRKIPRWIENGPCSVTVFYVLSGFVLSLVADREPQPASRASFYAKRFARLVPLYWLGLLLYACNPSLLRLFWSGSDGINQRIVYHQTDMLLTLVLTPLAVQTWIPFRQIWFLWNGVGWSVSNEVFFYLIFPIVHPMVARWSGTVSRTYCAISALCVLQGVCVVAYSWAVCLVWKGLDPSRAVRSVEMEVYASPFIRVFHFLMGMLLGSRFRRADTKPPAWAADVAVATCILLLVAVPVTVNGGYVLNDRSFQAIAAVTFWLLGPAFGAAIYCMAFDQGGLSCRLLGSRPLVHLGKWSYAIYILHLPLLAWYVYTIRGGGSQSVYCIMGNHHACEGGLLGGHLAAAVMLVVVLSAAAHVTIEAPLQRWLRQRLLTQHACWCKGSR